jgi:hypothetical protein
MNTFHLNTEGFKTFHKRFLFIFLIVFIIIPPTLVYVAPQNEFKILPFIITMIVFIIGIGMGGFIGYRRLRETWPTYTLTIGEDYIFRKQLHYPDIKIDKNEITTIKNVYMGVVIKTKDWRKFILIPHGLEKMEEAKYLLSQWKPIEKYSKKKIFFAVFLGTIIICGVLLFFKYFLFPIKPSRITMDVIVFILLSTVLVLPFIIKRLKLPVDERALAPRWFFILSIIILVLLLMSMLGHLLFDVLAK